MKLNYLTQNPQIAGSFQSIQQPFEGILSKDTNAYDLQKKKQKLDYTFTLNFSLTLK